MSGAWLEQLLCRRTLERVLEAPGAVLGRMEGEAVVVLQVNVLLLLLVVVHSMVRTAPEQNETGR